MVQGRVVGGSRLLAVEGCGTETLCYTTAGKGHSFSEEESVVVSMRFGDVVNCWEPGT